MSICKQIQKIGPLIRSHIKQEHLQADQEERTNSLEDIVALEKNIMTPTSR